MKNLAIIPTFNPIERRELLWHQRADPVESGARVLQPPRASCIRLYESRRASGKLAGRLCGGQRVIVAAVSLFSFNQGGTNG